MRPSRYSTKACTLNTHNPPSSETSLLRQKQADTHKWAQTLLIYTHICAHMCTKTHTRSLFIWGCFPFMSGWLALFVGSQSPAEADLYWTNQSRGRGRRIFDDRWEILTDTSLWSREDLVYGKTGRLMSWSSEGNKGWKDGVGGWGPDSSCSDPAPDWFSEHTREWPFNSKPTFSLVHTHYHQGTLQYVRGMIDILHVSARILISKEHTKRSKYETSPIIHSKTTFKDLWKSF